MAAAASAPVDGSEDVVSCVHCLEVEPYLIDPRMLPCGHIFCSSCLSKDAKTNQVIKCANCRCAAIYLVVSIFNVYIYIENTYIYIVCIAPEMTS